MRIEQAVVAQFRRPTGLFGRLVGFILAHRDSNRRRNAWTVETLTIRPGERVLELGCGPGLAVEAALAKGAHVLALDHSEEMIRQATRRCRQAVQAGRAELRLSSGLEALRPHDTFDAAFMINVAMFLPDPTQAFATIGRALHPGGRLAVTHQPRHLGAKPEDADAFAAKVKQQMAAAGFRDIAQHALPLVPIPAVCVVGFR